MSPPPTDEGLSDAEIAGIVVAGVVVAVLIVGAIVLTIIFCIWWYVYFYNHTLHVLKASSVNIKQIIFN